MDFFPTTNRINGWVKRFGLILAILFLGFGGPSCKRKSPPSSANDTAVVIGTVYPLADVARQIGGDGVDVSWIVESGSSVQSVQDTQPLRARIGRVDLV